MHELHALEPTILGLEGRCSKSIQLRELFPESSGLAKNHRMIHCGDSSF